MDAIQAPRTKLPLNTRLTYPHQNGLRVRNPLEIYCLHADDTRKEF